MENSIANLKEEVQNAIKHARIKKAFDLLEAYIDEHAAWAEADFASLSGKYQKLIRAQRVNTIRKDEAEFQHGQIVQELLNFPDIIAEGPVEDEHSDIGGGDSTEAKKQTILFLSSNPADTGPLQLAKEHREIKRGLETAISREQFDLETETAVRASDMRDAIRRKKPAIVHFSGHGLSKNDIVVDEIDGTRGLTWMKAARPEVTEHGVSGVGIALLDRNGNTHLVKNGILAKMFSLAKDDVQCVVFNNCYSQGQAEAVKEHIPFVIGMNRAVPDETAIAFAVEFYKALGDGESIPEAFEHAKVALEMDDYPGWDIPILMQ